MKRNVRAAAIAKIGSDLAVINLDTWEAGAERNPGAERFDPRPFTILGMVGRTFPPTRSDEVGIRAAVPQQLLASGEGFPVRRRVLVSSSPETSDTTGDRPSETLTGAYDGSNRPFAA